MTRPQDSSARRPTGKRLRFEVFKRDYFTCRYCGAQPPDVVLVVDHVVPVVEGGTSDIANLMTACEACNQGKGGRSLGDVVPRVDGDLLYLETQQEVAEIRRYQRAIVAKEAALDELIETLQSLWVKESGLDWHPAERILGPLLRRYPLEAVGAAIVDVAPKVGSGYIPSFNNFKWVGYLNAVCRTMAAEMGIAEEED